MRSTRRASSASASAPLACGRSAAPQAADAALATVRAVARGTENLLPPMREALRAHCTIGEICTVLRDEWGMYDHERAPR